MSGRIRADLDGSVFLHKPDGTFTVLVAGDEVPKGAEVGDHLLEDASAGDAGAPAVGATRGDWEDYAVSRGMAREQAEGYPNKDELIAALG